MSQRIAVLALALLALPVRAAEPTAQQVEFFEKKIRPVLKDQCWSCHSAEAAKNKKLRGGLYLDSRAALLKGGDSGPSLDAKEPGESLLLQAIRHDDPALKMPPKGKLSAAVIADWTRWVELGAPWPATAVQTPTASKGPDYDRLRREHWAYQPLKAVAPPAGAAPPIDRFVAARLAAKGLQPAPAAEKAVLLRRLYFDLVGLPPTPAQLDAFLKDDAPEAYQKQVDALLASPHFGERWGRHWLDVVRYAESLTLRGFVLKDAWRYRDYVIESFNQDLPFDRFVQEQIAGDLLPADTAEQRRRQMIATTFLMLGNTNLEEQNKKQLDMDLIDEQLDVLGKAFLGQTLGCARCHDHKFDPIPTKEYYALAGILASVKALDHANVSKWLEIPLPDDPEREAEWQKNAARVAELQARIKTAKAALARGGSTAAVAAAGVVDPKTLPGIVVDDSQARKVGDWKASTAVRNYVGAGYLHDENAGKGAKTLTFIPELPQNGKYEVRLAYVTGGGRTPAAKVTVFSADGEKTIEVDQTAPPDIDGHFTALGRYNFEKNGQSFVIVSNEDSKGFVTADAVQFIPVELLDAPASGGREPPESATKPAARGADAPRSPDIIKQMEAELKQLQEQAAKRPTAISVRDQKGRDVRIHIRGTVQNQGDLVPRGFLTCVPVRQLPAIPADQSGRLELGRWLTAVDNPLPARVLANRVWHWLFGQGLVRTVDNFGTTGEAPSHPELLDYLAGQLVQDGWSIKKLIRQMVLSQTYQQGSRPDPKALAADPENRLLGRMNRRRLDAECLFDAMLSASGELDLKRGGPSYRANLGSDYGYKYTELRRAVYAPVFRNSLPELFEVFDFADPSLPTGGRNTSTVAPQALFMLNSPWVRDRAKVMAERLMGQKELDDGRRLELAYRLTLGRLPTAGERAVGQQFLASAPGTTAWPQLVQALFASMDFRYVE